MKTTSRQLKKIKFACIEDVPADYRSLCSDLWLPRPIRGKSDDKIVTQIVDSLSVFEDLNEDQKDYLDMVSDLLEDYEGDVDVAFSPVQLLNRLMEENKLSGADISNILGGSRNLGTMIARGLRSITASHARKLADYFKLDVSAFIE